MKRTREDPFADVVTESPSPLSDIRRWLKAHLPSHAEEARMILVEAALAPFDEKRGIPMTVAPKANAMTLVVMKYLSNIRPESSQDELIARLALDHMTALDTRNVRGRIFNTERIDVRRRFGETTEKVCVTLYLMACAAERIEKEADKLT